LPLSSALYICQEASTNQLFLCKTNPISERPKMNANVFITKDYENETTLRLQKNKPNSNPIKPNLPEGKIDAKCVFTKEYEEKCG
jgi:hypothetical protein